MQVSFGACRLDLDSRQLFRDGGEVRLTPKAFELLALLIENRPRAVTKAELQERIWKGTFVTDDGLPRLVNEVRNAIGDAARDPRWLRTVHGYGYAFAGDAESSAPPLIGGYTLTWGSREFRLGDGVHLIGREPSATVCLDSTVISRRHAQIVVAGSGARIEDLGSKNGTFVGDRPVTAPRPLRDGDEIRVGDFTLTFHEAAILPTETRP
jgi:DNA-binding winged helix-turn-helix (wHTH) protein